jgi:hypothetical protein
VDRRNDYMMILHILLNTVSTRRMKLKAKIVQMWVWERTGQNLRAQCEQACFLYFEVANGDMTMISIKFHLVSSVIAVYPR